ncbi:phosphatase PAP2 family protein [Nocardioides mesophilus]|uniref:Phosphatase PAP2 family protein n=1 Tax=Nocardioides mesophilus TaxID=433659 RepID=A0A7G9RHR8_9ACTN|nr:phosphatase PAP2 family protein [Nocardioides mesophilus]QNN55143.1 phosphatase PAP2 family protein [Nocardioides mesophilus]
MWQHLQRDWFLPVNELARHTPGLHEPFRLYAQYGVLLFAAILALGWWTARANPNPRAMAAASWAPVGALVALGLNQPLGRLVHEARPYAVFPHALVLVARSHDFSFPSDHAVMAGAVAAGVLLTHRRLGLITLAAAVLLAFTRVYVGAHFPLDVIAGLLFGAAVTVATYLAVRPVLVRIVEALARTPLRPLVTNEDADHREPGTTPGHEAV